MSDYDHQLQPAEQTDLDHQDRNKVQPQTAEPYGDQELAAESLVHFSHHFAGQPLETRADRDANEQVRAERRERAKIDPVFRKQQGIKLSDDEIEVHSADIAVPLLFPLPESDDPEDPDVETTEPVFDELSDEQLEHLTAPPEPSEVDPPNVPQEPYPAPDSTKEV